MLVLARLCGCGRTPAARGSGVLATTLLAFALTVLSSLVSPAGAEDVVVVDKEAKRESMESTIMCTFEGTPIVDVVDWVFYFELLKSECTYADVQFRVLCGPQAVLWSSMITEQIVQIMKNEEYNLYCPNGVVQAASIALAHNTSHFLPHRWVIKEALQKSYVLDNSKWHVKSVDALELLQDTYDRTQFLVPGTPTWLRAQDSVMAETRRQKLAPPRAPGPHSIANERLLLGGGESSNEEDFPVPRRAAHALRPGEVTVLLPFARKPTAGHGAHQQGGSSPAVPRLYKRVESAFPALYPRKLSHSLGRKLNEMVARVRTEYTLVVASELMPSLDDVRNLQNVFELDDGFLTALSFSVLDTEKRVIDFCRSLKAKHWVLEFGRDYFSYVIKRDSLLNIKSGARNGHGGETTTNADAGLHERKIIYNEDGSEQSGSSVRGSTLFGADELQSCKTCHTLAPTFLARTASLQEGAPFRVSLDGEWALLDWFLRKSWHEKLEHGVAQCIGGYLKPDPALLEGALLGGPAMIDQSTGELTASSLGETRSYSSAPAEQAVPTLREWRHLWGLRTDVEYWFSSGPSRNFPSWKNLLLPVGSQTGLDLQVKEFIDKNDLKEIVSIDGERRYETGSIAGVAKRHLN